MPSQGGLVSGTTSGSGGLAEAWTGNVYYPIQFSKVLNSTVAVVRDVGGVVGEGAYAKLDPSLINCINICMYCRLTDVVMTANYFVIGVS